MLHRENCTDMERKLIERILEDPEARKIAEEFIRSQCPSDQQGLSSSQEAAQE